MLKRAPWCTVVCVVTPARFATLLLIVIVTLTAGLPAHASAPSDTGVSLTNFSESEGCPPGIRGPRRSDEGSGGSLSGAVIHGPWGDFFGRSRAQVESSLVNWAVPNSTGGYTVRIHERAVPAYQQVSAALGDRRLVVRKPDASGISFVNGMSSFDPDYEAFIEGQRRRYLDETRQPDDSIEATYFRFSHRVMLNMKRHILNNRLFTKAF